MTVVRVIRDVPPLVQLACAVLLAIPFALWLPFDSWGLAHTPHFFVFFLIGCRAREGVIGFVRSADWLRLAGLAAAATVLVIAAVLDPRLQPAVYALTPLVAVPVVLIGSLWASRMPVARTPAAALGRNTLPIFLLHPVVLQATALVAPDNARSHGLLSWLLPVIGTVAAVAVALSAWMVLRRVPGVFEAPARSSHGSAARMG